MTPIGNKLHTVFQSSKQASSSGRGWRRQHLFLWEKEVWSGCASLSLPNCLMIVIALKMIHLRWEITLAPMTDNDLFSSRRTDASLELARIIIDWLSTEGGNSLSITYFSCARITTALCSVAHRARNAKIFKTFIFFVIEKVFAQWSKKSFMLIFFQL